MGPIGKIRVTFKGAVGFKWFMKVTDAPFNYAGTLLGQKKAPYWSSYYQMNHVLYFIVSWPSTSSCQADEPKPTKPLAKTATKLVGGKTSSNKHTYQNNPVLQYI